MTGRQRAGPARWSGGTLPAAHSPDQEALTALTGAMPGRTRFYWISLTERPIGLMESPTSWLFAFDFPFQITPRAAAVPRYQSSPFQAAIHANSQRQETRIGWGPKPPEFMEAELHRGGFGSEHVSSWKGGSPENKAPLRALASSSLDTGPGFLIPWKGKHKKTCSGKAFIRFGLVKFTVIC